jgi:hypothetical protein
MKPQIFTLDSWITSTPNLLESLRPIEDVTYYCPCGSVFDFSELEEEAQYIDSVIDYWFTTETCPDCAG